MNYGITTQINCSYEQAIEKVKEALQSEGFGVLTEIDVKTTLKKKLDIDVDKYIILGACNPHFAHQALEIEQELGLLLPCNVIVYEKESKIYVSVINPSVAMGFVENKNLETIAQQVKEKLQKVIDSLN
jgi:uncharacterized protein (DUF302 family)